MRKTKKSLLLLTIIISTFFLVCCSASKKEQVLNEPTKGYLWEATKGEDSIYLVGTVHIKAKDTNFLNDNIKEIIEKTDGVALEVDLQTPENIVKAKEYVKNDFASKDGELKELLTEDEGIKLDEMLKDYNIKYSDVKNLSSDVLNSIIVDKGVLLCGFELGGLDEKLESQYKSKDKKIMELETFDFQRNLLKSLGTIDDLKNMLDEYDADSLKKAIDDVKNLYQAFSNGDKDYIQAQLEKSKEDPKSYKSVLVDRNINMVDKIDSIAKGNGKYMVAVGSLHYFGEDGIVKLLENKGYTVKEIN